MMETGKAEAIEPIRGFLGRIGISTEETSLPAETFLPGLAIRGGAIWFDRARLLWPGDLLHEAGHIAVTEQARRHALESVEDEPGDEMGAIAWSWAAAMAAEIDPALVFHSGGYRGSSEAYLANFGAGRYLGVPMLACYGMTREPHVARREGLPGFPHMIRWLR